MKQLDSSVVVKSNIAQICEMGRTICDMYFMWRDGVTFGLVDIYIDLLKQ